MTFSSKLLLFGEHTVLQGSAALALPLPLFQGEWAWAETENAASLQRNLPAWCQYLTKQQAEGKLETKLDLPRFADELQAGLYFRSNIPDGYGTGSSGAVCAALYARYALPPIDQEDAARYPELKRILGQMESFFHGASSGTDPLIIYLDRPVLLSEDGKIESIPLPAWPQAASGWQFFLLDTGQSRSTSQWVNLFLERCKVSAYQEQVKTQLIPVTEEAIRLFQQAQWPELYGNWQQISALQQQLLEPMIPPAFKKLWEQGLEAGHYALKLCGAGGGGFLLGMGKTGFLPPNAIVLHES
ncbi:MAG TPA: hypothetical protein PLC89_10780 [Haliscomenobacter sp.]|uniref:mevalonate kinase family protein n=1 Tax=Haliscomenobacter sp. TaxID=2717303 RepID=UPI002C0FCCCB|nr:hypothetical protein [Haliscomenobacter sp.]HOY17773.1 hypothetical protein [Haliscomenobacter sp.]HPH17242.1 hypothetical protein [Haliscomenobacter sp.]